VPNAVRLASDGYVSGEWGTEYHEGTATSVEKKAESVEATVRVQGAYNFEYTTPYPGERVCPRMGSLHWKPGAGFRVQKTGESCDAEYED